ncbi:MAG: diacylglycerol kinase family lipid kinase [Deltaproteobacteria bacterium]|nr:diacylglycerol kinase family lipid kinase [Deltaproteobacteria bacterium]
MKTLFIVNPAAQSGKCKKLWGGIEPLVKDLFAYFEVNFTKASDHATELTREALKDGFQKIISVGGDGTLSQVANGFFENDSLINKDALLGMLPLGTGVDFQKNFLASPTSIQNTVEVLAQNNFQKIDVGRITSLLLQVPAGPWQSYFINISSAGLSSKVLRNMNSTKKYLGPLAYMSSSIYTFLKEKPIVFRLKKDDETMERSYLAYNIFIANGKSSGGGMQWAQQAKVDDGLFHIVVLGKLPKWKIALLVPKIYQGTLSTEKEVETFTCRSLVVESDESCQLEIDGELGVNLPVKFEILQKALNFIC